MTHTPGTEYSKDTLQTPKRNTGIERRAAEEKKQRHASQPVSAGEWLRQVLGSDAPFGQDGLPTVWG